MTAPRLGLGLAVVLAACTSVPPAAEAWPAAEALFASDPRWLGGDAVYSVDLGQDRILWLFGDSFVATDGRGDRRTATMVRNTVAVQHGRDPTRAAIAFSWRTGSDGAPAPLFGDEGPHGFWPLHGVRLPGGPLLLFQSRVRNTPGRGLGFAIDGWRLVRIDNPDAPPVAWRWRPVAFATVPAGVTVGTAAWLADGWLMALGTIGDGPHRGVLVRLAIADLDLASVPLQCWSGDRWTVATAAAPAAVVIDDAGPECSLAPNAGGWLHVQSRGFGATTVAARVAAQPSGPWTAPVDLFTPPESRGERPFVYAAKAHAAIDAGDGRLLITYAANAFDFAELFTPAGQRQLYWPRCWRVRTAGLPRPGVVSSTRATK